jgi:hypothetical protein
MTSADTTQGNAIPAATESRPAPRLFLGCAILLLVHLFMVCFRYGQLPIAPVVGDEIIINDASISLAQGHGYAARSFADSKYGLDRIFAHFPPVYPYLEALAFHVFGVSVYSLRLTTTLMSISAMLVFLLILCQLYRAGLLDWKVALLLGALYGTNPSLMAFDRTARMESTISLLVMLSLLAVFHACIGPPDRRVWPAVLAAAFFAALGLAVHPEAATAVLFIGALILFLVPGALRSKLASAGVLALVPLIVGFAIFGRNLFTALRQFASIAQDAKSTEETSLEHIAGMLHKPNAVTLNRGLFLLAIIVLLLMVPAAYVKFVRRLPRGGLRYRLGICLAATGIVEVLLMVFLLRMNERRYEFLFGPLLLCDAVCLLGAMPLRGWQRTLGWAVVAGQGFVVAFYLAAPNHSATDRNPDRFLPLVHSLPAGASVASTPVFWLDLQEAHRPFSLIYYGMDGETAWTEGAGNPLDRFDVILLDEFYISGRPWWQVEAQAGRRKYLYTIGSESIEVYVRNDLPLPR